MKIQHSFHDNNVDRKKLPAISFHTNIFIEKSLYRKTPLTLWVTRAQKFLSDYRKCPSHFHASNSSGNEKIVVFQSWMKLEPNGRKSVNNISSNQISDKYEVKIAHEFWQVQNFQRELLILLFLETISLLGLDFWQLGCDYQWIALF